MEGYGLEIANTEEVHEYVKNFANTNLPRALRFIHIGGLLDHGGKQ